MATHTFLGRTSGGDWRDVDFVAVVRATGDQIVILNSDGTETHLFSANGDFVEGLGGFSGTVSSMARTDEGGAVVYETVSSVGLGVSDLLGGGGQLFDLVLDMAATVGGAGAGGDTLDISGWSQFSLASFGNGVADEVAAQSSVVAYLDGFTTTTGSLSEGESLALSSMGAGLDVLEAFSFTDLGAAGTGTGTLIADFASSSAGVMVDLASDTASTVGGNVALADTTRDIVGSAFDDNLIGDAYDNVVLGGGGDDLITLGAGNDTLVFGLGDGLDTVTDFGMAGLDTISLQGYAGISSFAQLLDEQRLLTVDGQAMVLLNGGDGVILQNVTSHTLLTASQFQF